VNLAPEFLKRINLNLLNLTNTESLNCIRSW